MADNRVDLTLDLDEDVLWELFMMAHKRDITLNALVERILTQYIEEEKARRAADAA